MLEGWIFPLASFPFIVWFGGRFPSLLHELGWTLHLGSMWLQPKHPWDLSHGQSTPSVTWKLWKLITVLTATARAGTRCLCSLWLYVWVGTYLGSADSPVPKEKQSCFLCACPGDWLQMMQCPAFWITAALKEVIPFLTSLGISCYAQSLETFPEDLQMWAIAGFVGTVGSGIPVPSRASLGSAVLSDAECLWTPLFQPHVIGPQVTEREPDSPKSWQPLLWCAVPKCDLHRAISVRLLPLKTASQLLLCSRQ